MTCIDEWQVTCRRLLSVVDCGTYNTTAIHWLNFQRNWPENQVGLVYALEQIKLSATTRDPNRPWDEIEDQGLVELRQLVEGLRFPVEGEAFMQT